MRSGQIKGLRYSGVLAAEEVLDCVRRAGAEPVILPPVPGAWPASRLSGMFAALVLPGGADLDPVRYGGTAGSSIGPADELQDEADLALVHAAIDAGIPMLAICRGMQALNVALGGSLVEDLPPGKIPHRTGFHQVDLVADSLVAQVMGTNAPVVSSVHHQAVGRLGDGLEVTGRSEDGVIESIQHRSAPILAVQWHPEDNANLNAAEQALFDALLDPTWIIRQEVNT